MSAPNPPRVINPLFSPGNLLQLIGMSAVAISIFFSMQARIDVMESKISIMKEAYDAQFFELKNQRLQDMLRFEKSVDKLTDRIEKLTSKIDFVAVGGSSYVN